MGMSSAAGLLAGYARLREQVAAMLALTEAGDWEALIARQAAYLQLVDRLRQLDGEVILDREGMACKAELLEAILADDLAIREQLMARRSELARLMDSGRRQRDLHRSYGKQAAVVVNATDTFGTGSS